MKPGTTVTGPGGTAKESVTVTCLAPVATISADTITVYREAAGDYINLRADPISGVPHFETILKIDGSFDISSSHINYVGPGTVEFLETSATEHRVALYTEGTYTFTATATDDVGYDHTSSVTVEVMDEAVLDALLQGKWAGMKADLVAGDVEGALEYNLEYSRVKYAAIYSALGSNLPVLAQQMQNISTVFYDEARAKYRIHKDQEIEGKIVTIAYYIYFSKDHKGIWKIEPY